MKYISNWIFKVFKKIFNADFAQILDFTWSTEFYIELSVGYEVKTWIFWGYVGKVLDFLMDKLKPWTC